MTFTTLETVQHITKPNGWEIEWATTVIGVRLTEAGLLEYATRTLHPGRAALDRTELGPLKVHAPGEKHWETSYHQLRKFLKNVKSLKVHPAECLTARRGVDSPGAVERAARAAFEQDCLLEDAHAAT